VKYIIEPKNGYIIIERDSAATESNGMVTETGKTGSKPMTGKVIVSSPKASEETGVSNGDSVLFTGWAGTESPSIGENIVCIEYTDLIGIITGGQNDA